MNERQDNRMAILTNKNPGIRLFFPEPDSKKNNSSIYQKGK